MAYTKEQQREYDKKYRELNREKIIARHRKYKEEQKAKDPEEWRNRVKAAVIKYQSKDPEKVKTLRENYEQKYPERIRARHQVKEAVKSGKLIRPSTCSICKRDGVRILAHHPDYSKPLEVIWMCYGCHRSHHVNNP